MSTAQSKTVAKSLDELTVQLAHWVMQLFRMMIWLKEI